MDVVEASRDSKVRVLADFTTRAWESESESEESSTHIFFLLLEAAELSELGSELDPLSDEEDATPCQKRDMV